MSCVMLHDEYLQNPVNTSNNGSPPVDNYSTSDNNQRNNVTPPLENNEASPSEKNVGPKLMFKPVPRPPSRPQTQMICTNEEASPHSPDDKALSHSSLPVYNGIPGKGHLRPQSPDLLEMQTSNRLRRVQSTSPPSVRAAAMFAVKKGTVTDFVDDNEAYAIPMNQVAVVNLKPSTVDDGLTNTDLIDITTIYGGVLQISFYYHHEQDLLLGFLQAFLLPSVLNIQTDMERTQTDMERTLGDSRDRSVSSMDMDNFEARAVKCRFLNESLWDKFKRRTTHWLSRTEEMCLSCDDNSTYTCASRSKGDQTQMTELEIDDGLGLKHDLSNIEEDDHHDSGYSTQVTSTIDSQIDRKYDCSPSMPLTLDTIIDDRDDAAYVERNIP